MGDHASAKRSVGVEHAVDGSRGHVDEIDRDARGGAAVGTAIDGPVQGPDQSLSSRSRQATGAATKLEGERGETEVTFPSGRRVFT